MSTTIETFYKDRITVACTWGDGPDILMDCCFLPFPNRKGDRAFVGEDGTVFIGIDLKAPEAREIAKALLKAADQSDEMDRLLEKDFNS